MFVNSFQNIIKNLDNYRIRTYEGEPICFQVKRLYQSAKLPYFVGTYYICLIIRERKTPERVAILKVMLLFMCSLLPYCNYISLGKPVLMIDKEANVHKCVKFFLVYSMS